MPGKLFLRREAAVKYRIYPEDGKEIDGHESTRRSLGVTSSRKDGLAAHEKSHIGKAVALRAPVGEIRIGDETFRLAGALVVLPEKCKALGMEIRKRAKEGGTGKAEDSGIRANADGQNK